MFAVDWQSAETVAGFEQLELQYVRSSSQLVSGGGVVPASGVVVAVGVGAGSAHAPRGTLFSFSIHARLRPATHEVSPHTSVRRTPAFSTAQVQSSLPPVHAAASTTVRTRATARRTTQV